MVRDVEQIREETERQQILGLMNRMLTAPKAKGLDDVRTLYVDGNEKASLAAFMRHHGEEKGRGGLVRDAGNVDKATALVVVGARPLFMALDCGTCDANTYAEANVPSPFERAAR